MNKVMASVGVLTLIAVGFLMFKKNPLQMFNKWCYLFMNIKWLKLFIVIKKLLNEYILKIFIFLFLFIYHLFYSLYIYVQINYNFSI
jgi:hypothetical protein